MAILDSAAIMPRTCVAADQVLVLDTVGSTNTYAADLVRAGRLFGMDGMDGIAGNLVWSGREIVVVAANEQTAVAGGSTIRGPVCRGSHSSCRWW